MKRNSVSDANRRLEELLGIEAQPPEKPATGWGWWKKEVLPLAIVAAIPLSFLSWRYHRHRQHEAMRREVFNELVFTIDGATGETTFAPRTPESPARLDEIRRKYKGN